MTTPHSTLFEAVVSYGGVTETFTVANAGNGKDWAATRAVAHFFYIHPELDRFRDLSFRLRRVHAERDGLAVVLAESLTDLGDVEDWSI